MRYNLSMDSTVSAFVGEISAKLEPLKNLNNPFFLDPNFLGAILTSLVALSLGYMSIMMQRKQTKHIGKQLRIEQEPFVVADGSIILVGSGRHEINIKNVGRGSALRITCSVDKRNSDKAFFEDIEPHSYYLSPNEKTKSTINEETKLVIEKNLRFYIFYKDQLGDAYVTDVGVKLLTDKFVIMENQRL